MSYVTNLALWLQYFNKLTYLNVVLAFHLLLGLRWRRSPRRHYIVPNTEVRTRSLLPSGNKHGLKL